MKLLVFIIVGMKNIYFILLVFLLIGSGANAQKKEYSLTDIVQIARSGSTAWLRAETRKGNRFWRYKTFKSNYAPKLELNSHLPSFTKTLTPVTQPDGNVIYREVHNNNVSVQLGLSQVISLTGGTVYISSDLGRYDDFILDYSQFNSQPILVGLNQPIFKFNSYKWDNLIEPLKYEESQINYFSELEQISITATHYFFNLLLSQQEFEIMEKNSTSNKELYGQAIMRSKHSKVLKNDLLQLELNVINSELAVAQAKVKMQSDVFNLKWYIGLGEDELLHLKTPSYIPAFYIDETKALELALENKSNLVSYKRKRLEANKNVDWAKKKSGVTMNLKASYGLTNQSQTIGDVYQNPVEGMELGLQMNVPIIDWGRQKARIKTAEANMKLVEYSLIQDENTFKQSVILLVRNFEILKKQVKARKKSDEIAYESFLISKQSFLDGELSVTDFNAALKTKDEAKKDYIKSLRDFWVGYYQIREKTLYDFEHQQLLVRNVQ